MKVSEKLEKLAALIGIELHALVVRQHGQVAADLNTSTDLMENGGCGRCDGTLTLK